jgi:hypothetical protein
MAVIEKYRYRLSEPSGDEDQVDRMVAIDIARFDQQAARRGNELNGLSPDGGKLKLNRVISTARAVLYGLNAGEIRTKVPVEIGDCKCQAWSNRSSRRIPNIVSRRRPAANEAKEQQ